MFRKNPLIQNLLSDLGALQRVRLAKALLVSLRNWNNPTVFEWKKGFFSLEISSIELRRLRCILDVARAIK